MKIITCNTRKELGKKAAEAGASLIRQAVKKDGCANIIVATGASQFEMLDALVTLPEIAWEKVVGFHLDEYIGLAVTHRASFRHYLWQRFVRRLPVPPAAFHFIDGESDPEMQCLRLNRIIANKTIHVAFVGIGENAHLAFNDPPADFKTSKPYHVVALDRACRSQQVGEGWFASLKAVPSRAISMSCRQILKAQTLIVSVPGKQKARAVKASVEGPVTPSVPASILQTHKDIRLFLDKQSASLLECANP